MTEKDASGQPKNRMEFIGRKLLEIQAERRNLRTENALFREQIARLEAHVVTRQELTEVFRAILDRIAQSEVLLEGRFERLEQRLDQTERSVEERLDRVEKGLKSGGSS